MWVLLQYWKQTHPTTNRLRLFRSLILFLQLLIFQIFCSSGIRDVMLKQADILWEYIWSQIWILCITWTLIFLAWITFLCEQCAVLNCQTLTCKTTWCNLNTYQVLLNANLQHKAYEVNVCTLNKNMQNLLIGLKRGLKVNCARFIRRLCKLYKIVVSSSFLLNHE